MIGFDFINAPSADELVANGANYVFVYAQDGRYPGNDWAYSVMDRGIGVMLIWERSALRSHDGYGAGAADAAAAEAYAGKIGYPANAVIWYNLGDTNGASANGHEAAIAEYARGVANNSNRPLGGYGPGHALDQTDWLRWVPETWGADGSQVVQVANTPSPIGDTDIDRIYTDLPAWGHGGPAPTPGDDDLTPEESKQLADIHTALFNNAFGAALAPRLLKVSQQVDKIHNAVFNNVYGVAMQQLAIETWKKVSGK